MKFFPKSADGFLSAMMMAENALLRDFSLSCPASLFGAEPMESAKKAVKSCMTLSSFPCAQMLKTNTRYVHDFAKRTLTVTANARYMSTGKEVNDLRCVAADIAEIVTKGGRTGTGYHIELIDRMGRAVIRMVDEAVLSFTNSDLELAKKVCKSDDEVDNLFNGAKNVLLDCIRNDEKLAERALDLMLVSKYLERIGDHATNIAEWVIFSITGVHVNTENG